MESLTLLLANEEATHAAGAALLSATNGIGLIALQGDLGSGKTTLVRGLLRAAGYQGRVKSPTYTLVEPYSEIGHGIYHFDLYRLADPEELEYIGIRDYLEEKALILLEWPERGEGLLPTADLTLMLSYQAFGRKLQIIAGNPYGLEIIKKWPEQTIF
ncbi:MAG: tRNA (adenosine(37)-N6)-threonylcarbamoyltransferase complex ATPase subunit type 1 TsaE [Gammaproteobacteria bacterium]|nr:tRNA (adenosine(37)-N6)-threonylcarbamoyltransferase complex ATPase subunit type 1 TsaE [Gammaproteobacteria bacterium]